MYTHTHTHTHTLCNFFSFFPCSFNFIFYLSWLLNQCRFIFFPDKKSAFYFFICLLKKFFHDFFFFFFFFFKSKDRVYSLWFKFGFKVMRDWVYNNNRWKKKRILICWVYFFPKVKCQHLFLQNIVLPFIWLVCVRLRAPFVLK